MPTSPATARTNRVYAKLKELEKKFEDAQGAGGKGGGGKGKGGGRVDGFDDLGDCEGHNDGGGQGRGRGGKGGGGGPPYHRSPVALRVLELDDDSKEQLNKLFQMMDTDLNGYLQLSDFELTASKGAMVPMVAKAKALMYFTKLQEELDADMDGRITKEEFTRGIIKLALQKPAGPMLHSLAGSSDLSAVMAACTRTTNLEVQELCKVLYNWWDGFRRE